MLGIIFKTDSTLKFLFTIIFVLIIYSVSSQSLTNPAYFTLFEKSCCDSTLYRSVNYRILTINGGSHTIYPDSTGVCRIYAPGEYLLRHGSADLPYWGKRVLIQGSTTDTVEIAPIHLKGKSRGIGPTYYHYVHCKKICNGKEISYWPNGGVRQDGTFKNGDVKKLISYYSNGTIKSKIKNKLLTDYIIHYDRTGKLLIKMKFQLFFSRAVMYDEKSDKYWKGTSFGHY